MIPQSGIFFNSFVLTLFAAFVSRNKKGRLFAAPKAL